MTTTPEAHALARLVVAARSPVDGAPVLRQVDDRGCGFEDVPDGWRFADLIEAPDPEPEAESRFHHFLMAALGGFLSGLAAAAWWVL